MYGPTTQCNGKNSFKCFGSLSMSVTYVLSLNRHWSIVRSMTICLMLDQPSFIRRLNSPISQNFNRPAPVALLRLCNFGTKVRSVRKSQVGANWGPASRNKAARWFACKVRWPVILLKLQLVPPLWLYIEYGIYGPQGIYLSICKPKIVMIDKVLAKLLQKYNSAYFCFAWWVAFLCCACCWWNKRATTHIWFHGSISQP